MAFLSALVVLFFVKPLTHDGMIEEDAAVSVIFEEKMAISFIAITQFRQYLEEHGYDTSNMGLLDSATSSNVEADVKAEGSLENEKV